MATYNFTGTEAGTNTINSADVVTFTGNTTVTGSITKTDSNAMTIHVASGVTITVSTGYVDIKGSRGNFVTFDSNAANPRKGDWTDIRFTGTSTNNTMQWCHLKNTLYGFLFLGHTPADNKFEYLIIENDGDLGSCLYNSATSGNFYMSDVCCINPGRGWHKSGGSTDVWSRIQIISPQDAPYMDEFAKSATINDLHIIDVHSAAPECSIDSGETLTIVGLYMDGPFCESTLSTSRSWLADAGVMDVTTFSVRNGGNHVPVRNDQAVGIINLTGGDVFGGGDSLQGIYSNTANKIVLDDVATFGTYGYDKDVFSTDADQTYQTDETAANMRSTRKFPIAATISSTGTPDSSSTTITGTTGCLAKARILYGTTSGTYTHSTEWDAQDLLLPDGTAIPSSVIDWVTSGKKYSTDLNSGIALSNLAADTTYYCVIEAVNMHGEVFRSSESNFSTTAVSGGGGVNPLIGLVGG